jgi:hypothetical protein
VGAGTSTRIEKNRDLFGKMLAIGVALDDRVISMIDRVPETGA